MTKPNFASKKYDNGNDREEAIERYKLRNRTSVLKCHNRNMIETPGYKEKFRLNQNAYKSANPTPSAPGVIKYHRRIFLKISETEI
jgi:hypothetical protein